MPRSLLLFLILGISIILTDGCRPGNWRDTSNNPDYLHRAIKQVTDVMVYDVYSPPVASRTYAYISVAGYETARPGDPSYLSLAGQLHGLKPVPVPDPTKTYSFSLASIKAVLAVGKTMVISEE